MINPDDIVFLISAVIASAFLLYFCSSAISKRSDIFTKLIGWIGAFIFLALFLRLLSVSNPAFMISSDLFLLITITTITVLTILLEKNMIKNPSSPSEVTSNINADRGLASFESYRAAKHSFPKSASHGASKLISVPKHRQILRLR
ncbi:MAG: hypothetical protein V1839_01310 [archaeon]